MELITRVARQIPSQDRLSLGLSCRRLCSIAMGNAHSLLCQCLYEAGFLPGTSGMSPKDVLNVSDRYNTALALGVYGVSSTLDLPRPTQHVYYNDGVLLFLVTTPTGTHANVHRLSSPLRGVSEDTFSWPLPGVLLGARSPHAPRPDLVFVAVEPEHDLVLFFWQRYIGPAHMPYVKKLFASIYTADHPAALSAFCPSSSPQAFL